MNQNNEQNNMRNLVSEFPNREELRSELPNGRKLVSELPNERCLYRCYDIEKINGSIVQEDPERLHYGIPPYTEKIIYLTTDFYDLVKNISVSRCLYLKKTLFKNTPYLQLMVPVFGGEYDYISFFKKDFKSYIRMNLVKKENNYTISELKQKLLADEFVLWLKDHNMESLSAVL